MTIMLLGKISFWSPVKSSKQLFLNTTQENMKPKIVVLQADNLLSQHKPTPTELSHQQYFEGIWASFFRFCTKLLPDFMFYCNKPDQSVDLMQCDHEIGKVAANLMNKTFKGAQG